MKTSFVVSLFALCLIALDAAPAPDLRNTEALEDASLPELQRTKRSQYGPGFNAVPYTSPCAAAAAPPYHLNMGPMHGPSIGYGFGGHGMQGGLIHGGYNGLNHYRSEDFEEDPESFRNMENEHHMRMMRAYGGYEGAAAAGGHGLGGIGLGGASSSAASGPALGIFPGSVGGCNVPLLVSCSPSISAGHLVKNHASHYGAGAAPYITAPVYRGEGTSAMHGAHTAEHHMDHMEPLRSEHHIGALHSEHHNEPQHSENHLGALHSAHHMEPQHYEHNMGALHSEHHMEPQHYEHDMGALHSEDHMKPQHSEHHMEALHSEDHMKPLRSEQHMDERHPNPDHGTSDHSKLNENHHI